jgi:hypothetical protein
MIISNFSEKIVYAPRNLIWPVSMSPRMDLSPGINIETCVLKKSFSFFCSKIFWNRSSLFGLIFLQKLSFLKETEMK